MLTLMYKGMLAYVSQIIKLIFTHMFKFKFKLYFIKHEQLLYTETAVRFLTGVAGITVYSGGRDFLLSLVIHFITPTFNLGMDASSLRFLLTDLYSLPPLYTNPALEVSSE